EIVEQALAAVPPHHRERGCNDAPTRVGTHSHVLIRSRFFYRHSLPVTLCCGGYSSSSAAHQHACRRVGSSRVVRHVDYRRVTAGIVEARCKQPLNAERAARICERQRYGMAIPSLRGWADPIVARTSRAGASVPCGSVSLRSCYFNKKNQTVAIRAAKI